MRPMIRADHCSHRLVRLFEGRVAHDFFEHKGDVARIAAVFDLREDHVVDVHPERDFLVAATGNQEGEKHVRGVVVVQHIAQVETQKLISFR